MLATLVDRPFHRPGWVYEEKYDGYRILAYKEGKKVSLFSRNAKNRTDAFAEIAAAIGRLPSRTLLLDGEVVAFDRKRVSRFQLLQRGRAPRVYAVFDCLYRNGRDLRGEPLLVRRRQMEASLEGGDRLLASRRLSANGLDAYRAARRKGFEGLVAKDPTAPYVEGRSTKWLKVKVHQEEELVIAGYTPPSGSRAYIGALLLAGYRNGRLRYAGKVGTGFAQATLASLHAAFRPLVRRKSSLYDPPREEGAVWLAPKLVAQIAFAEWTEDGKLRQPVFLGLRDDKKPSECVLPEVGR